MQVPVQITMKDVPHTDELEAKIHEKASKLEQFCSDIISCQVVIGASQNHKQQGKLHSVRVNLAVPGKKLTANKDNCEDVHLAVRDSFDSVQRQLEDHTRRVHGEVKSHPELAAGEIVRLFAEDGFGFIEDADGTEYYFNSDNVVNPTFEKLEVGSKVHFIEVVGSEGLQAHRVSAEKE